MRPAYRGLRSGHGNPVVCGRRFCASCGRWRVVVDFDVQRSHGRPDRLRSWCQCCQRGSNRRSIARRTADQQAERREYQRMWCEMQRRRAGTPPRNFAARVPISPGRQRTVDDEHPIERALLGRSSLIDELRRRLDAAELAIVDLAIASGIPNARVQEIIACVENARIEEIDRLIYAEFLAGVAG